MTHVEKTVAALRARFPDAIEDVIEFRGETTVVIAPPALVEVCAFLRDDPELGYNYLADL
ncbi:MAG: NADH-quinone oxidoreductase subunit C, partial [Chloroflexi bacterium]|nr:NADH-quinone oxidoreductase subunit C [Chloroflexota bacterium]